MEPNDVHAYASRFFTHGMIGTFVRAAIYPSKSDIYLSAPRIGLGTILIGLAEAPEVVEVGRRLGHPVDSWKVLLRSIGEYVLRQEEKFEKSVRGRDGASLSSMEKPIYDIPGMTSDLSLVLERARKIAAPNHRFNPLHCFRALLDTNHVSAQLTRHGIDLETIKHIVDKAIQDA